MNKTALAFGIGASLLLAAGTASAAGNCTMEIDALQQKLGMDEGANARTGPADTGVQQPSPSASADMSSSGSSTGATTDMSNGSSVATNNESTGTNATIGPTDPGVQQPSPAANDTTGTGGTGTTADTGTMASNSGSGSTYGANTENGGSDMSASNSGSSDTMSNGSSGAMSSSPSGTSTMSPTIAETSRSGELNSITPSARSSVLASLEKAKLYAKSGEEEACMTEVGNAKQQLGIQ
ncbi:MAG TPA: hypothetical protein VFG64_09780 [Dongiaceae bacterium]|nr:hypothetical protein [Dongiaceae bacterium]